MIEIIPAIDLIDGQCVRLTQGDYDQKKVYNSDPLEVAKQYEDAGIKRLHMVDLDGAKAGEVKNLKVLERVASNTTLDIDYGGGIKSEASLTAVLNSGAQWVSIGSLAVKGQDTFSQWITNYGGDKFLLGADVKEENIAVGGWLESSDWNVIDFIELYLEKGITKVFCTDIAKDGLLQGPSIELYQKIMTKFPDLHLIASGGVKDMDDIYELDKIGCAAVIVGKAIYEGRVTIKELAALNQ